MDNKNFGELFWANIAPEIENSFRILACKCLDNDAIDVDHCILRIDDNNRKLQKTMSLLADEQAKMWKRVVKAMKQKNDPQDN